ncbi:MAG: GNAT family N-acetyltransferase [Dehalococcoidia bacterium]
MVSEAEMHANYSYALRRVGTLAEGAASAEIGPWSLMYSGLPDGRSNIGVLRREPENVVDALVRAEEWFEQHGVTSIRLDLRSKDDAPMLAAAEVSGYSRWWVEPAMSMDPLPERWEGIPRLEVRQVETEEEVRAYVELEAEEHAESWFQAAMTRTAMRMEGHVLLVGSADGAPVARSMAVVRDGVVGVHNVYVPPSARQRGYGAAITAATVDVGRELGARAACLEASEMGAPVYRRMGFVRRYDYVVVGRRVVEG